MSNSTLLVLDGITLSDYASRGISSTLSPIATGALRRDVNGNLVDMTLSQFRKFALQLSCKDIEVPGLEAVWRGKLVSVTLIPGFGVAATNTDGTTTLDMMVDSWQVQQDDEWEVLKSWTMSLLQV